MKHFLSLFVYCYKSNIWTETRTTTVISRTRSNLVLVVVLVVAAKTPYWHINGGCEENKGLIAGYLLARSPIDVFLLVMSALSCKSWAHSRNWTRDRLCAASWRHQFPIRGCPGVLIRMRNMIYINVKVLWAYWVIILLYNMHSFPIQITSLIGIHSNVLNNSASDSLASKIRCAQRFWNPTSFSCSFEKLP